LETKEQIYSRYTQLIDYCRLHRDDISLEKIEDAFRFAQSVIGECRFKTGEVILSHSLQVANVIATEIGMEADSIVAGILHNVMYAGLEIKATRGEIEKKFGEPLYSILEGMLKINALGTDTADIHSENYRKLLLALAGDVRVIIIKIADRLQVMRNLELYEPENRTRLVIETSHLYAPLAHRLGLYAITSELQDLCLKFQRPEEYNYVVSRLNETENERANFVAEFVKPVEIKLQKRGMKFSMKARTKSIFSIWNKMQKKSVAFDEVIDLFAIRIILNSKPEEEKTDCWTAYSFVTEEYQTNPERLRDWITVPKSNGYESLHTTVMGPHRKWVEIQIRTKRMDEIAEKGLAAHWKYKEGKASSGFDKWLAGVRDILENPNLNVADFIDDFRTDIYGDEIFVFTPKGDLIKLPQGATMLDFAYEIHSELGDHCVGGKVDGKKVTLKHKLKNGNQISIDTSNNQSPKMDWLDFLVTSKAKNRVKASLNEERNRQAAHGKEILIRKFKNWKLDFDDDNIRKMLKKYGFKLAADLYYDVAIGKIDPLDIKLLLTEKTEVESTKRTLDELLPKNNLKELTFDNANDFLVIDNNLKNINYKLASCCNPVFGDKIFGFVSIRDGIKIHRDRCPNSPQMKERFPYRIIKARWKEHNTSSRNSFLATLHISGTDEIGIVPEISHIITKDIGTQMRSINIESDRGNFEGVLKLFVYNLEHLEFLIQQIKKVKGVISVTRGEK
jgi:GTP pyrophosphokinase